MDKRNYIIEDEDTGEKFKLVGSTIPRFSVEYTEKDGVKSKIKVKWEPIEYDFSEAV